MNAPISFIIIAGAMGHVSIVGGTVPVVVEDMTGVCRFHGADTCTTTSRRKGFWTIATSLAKAALVAVLAAMITSLLLDILDVFSLWNLVPH